MLTRTLITGTPLHAVAEEMDRVLDTMVSAARPRRGAAAPSARPAMNLWESESALLAEAELPGLTLDDLELDVTADELTLRGRRAIPSPENGRALRREREAGPFERTLALPIEVDVDRIEATLRNGILFVTMPKAPSARARRIEIRDADEDRGER